MWVFENICVFVSMLMCELLCVCVCVCIFACMRASWCLCIYLCISQWSALSSTQGLNHTRRNCTINVLCVQTNPVVHNVSKMFCFRFVFCLLFVCLFVCLFCRFFIFFFFLCVFIYLFICLFVYLFSLSLNFGTRGRFLSVSLCLSTPMNLINISE